MIWSIQCTAAGYYYRYVTWFVMSPAETGLPSRETTRTVATINVATCYY